MTLFNKKNISVAITLFLFFGNYSVNASLNVEETNNKCASPSVRNQPILDNTPKILANRGTQKKRWYQIVLEGFSFTMSRAPMPLPNFSLRAQ